MDDAGRAGEQDRREHPERQPRQHPDRHHARQGHDQAGPSGDEDRQPDDAHHLQPRPSRRPCRRRCRRHRGGRLAATELAVTELAGAELAVTELAATGLRAPPARPGGSQHEPEREQRAAPQGQAIGAVGPELDPDLTPDAGRHDERLPVAVHRRRREGPIPDPGPPARVGVLGQREEPVIGRRLDGPVQPAAFALRQLSVNPGRDDRAGHRTLAGAPDHLHRHQVAPRLDRDRIRAGRQPDRVAGLPHQ